MIKTACNRCGETIKEGNLIGLRIVAYEIENEDELADFLSDEFSLENEDKIMLCLACFREFCKEYDLKLIKPEQETK